MAQWSTLVGQRSHLTRYPCQPRAAGITLVVAVAALGGCASIVEYLPAPPLNPAAPVISVSSNGVLVTRQDPLVFSRDQKNVTITWRLQGVGLSFPQEGGVVIDGEVCAEDPRLKDGRCTAVVPRAPASTDSASGPKPLAATTFLTRVDARTGEIRDCQRVDDKTFTCVNANSRPGTYQYTIRALLNGKPLPPLDPTIMNP